MALKYDDKLLCNIDVINLANGLSKEFGSHSSNAMNPLTYLLLRLKILGINIRVFHKSFKGEKIDGDISIVRILKNDYLIMINSDNSEKVVNFSLTNAIGRILLENFDVYTPINYFVLEDRNRKNAFSEQVKIAYANLFALFYLMPTGKFGKALIECNSNEDVAIRFNVPVGTIEARKYLYFALKGVCLNEFSKAK